MSNWSSQRRGSLPLLYSNLESFLQTVTPAMPRRSLVQNKVNGHEIEVDYFNLSDLWESCKQWSAYGVGSEIMLENGETIMQYYAPSLSALQLFHAKSPSQLSVTLDVNYRASNAEEHQAFCEDLYYEFYEEDSPYLRLPFTDKVLELAKQKPGIKTFKSTDLSPASWMAIAWYPICHFPDKRAIKDLSACFLSFHTLSSNFQVMLNDHNEVEEVGKKSRASGSGKIALPPFALATYKLQGKIWRNPFTSDEQRIHDLHSAACSWLKQLNVQNRHHDFNFFFLNSNF